MRKKSSDVVTGFIQEKIKSGEWSVGTKIYTEPQLQEATGVGKTSVREAVEQLCAVGVLEKRQGDGTYVRDFDLSTFVEKLIPNLRMSDADVMDFLQYRSIVEPACVQLFIEHGTFREYEQLETALDRMIADEKKGDSYDLHQADGEFHRIITHGCHNSVIANVMDALGNVMDNYHYTAGLTIGERTGIQEHRDILNAIRNKDKELGFLLMQRHLQRTIRDTLEYQKAHRTT